MTALPSKKQAVIFPSFFCPADDAILGVLAGDTECPLQVCQLSRSSESTHFPSLRRDVALFDSTKAPDSFEIGGTCL